MEHEGSNNNNNTNATVENTQRDSSINSTREFYISQSEPPGSTSSLPTSTSPTPSATTPLVTSPFNEQPSSGSANTTPSNSTLPTVSSTLTNNPTPMTATTTTTTTTTTTAATTAATTPATHKTQAAFVNKLYTMVEDQSIQHLISWAPSGDVFSVSNPTEFSKTVLPQYFKHNNWQSFVRQLNMYGFHKVNDMFHANPSSESQAWEFRHQEFRRGHISALQNIRRKNSKHQSTSNQINMKGGLSNSGPGQSLSSDITAERDERIDSLTNQMAELMDRMRQMTENYSLLYAETVSCRMQQSKHEKVITDIANFLSSIFREEDANDPRSLKRKFDVDCIQAEVAKFGQGDSQTPSHLPLSQHPSHYPREGIQPARTIPTNPQPMSGVESTSSMHHTARMQDVDYRSNASPSFSGSQPLHRSPAKIPTSSPLSILPEFPFSPHMQPSTNYLRHRSPEPMTSVGSSGSVSRSSSMDTYKPTSISSSNSHTTQSSSQYTHSSPHRATHPPPHIPMSSSQHRRSSQPSSLGFGSDSNLLNPDGNRYKDNNSNPISQPPPQRPPSSPSTSSPTSYSKTDNPATANPTTSQSRPPPLPEPPDNETEFKRRKRN